MNDALEAYAQGREEAVLALTTDLGGEEEFPVRVFLRGPAEMDAVETRALGEAHGRVLDVGACAGAHTLPLLERGLDVVALDPLPAAVHLLRSRGVRDARRGTLESLDPEERFDTILLLMNGTGLAGTLGRLSAFLGKAAAHLREGGGILVDSTDPRDWDPPGDGRYPGELQYRLVFDDRTGPPFPYVFVDPETLAGAAFAADLDTEILVSDPDGHYLARLTSFEAR
ncbi:MAG: class I SAM-dependent methyltransferase [Gemmatimonadota bacterium]|nr:class I SAM-dependent methyltransferase [Gemmatimonadota bacterium]MDH5758816.1 class I SAM-dependent methyltransferase [Gemmatimonadota bacterium]